MKKTKFITANLLALIMAITQLIFTACSQNGMIKETDSLSEGILYKASQDPENAAYQWSIHDLLLTLDSNMEDIVADYATKYESYVHYYQEEYANDEESLQAAIRPEWISTVGENGSKGYISAIDLEWPGWQISHEEALEIIDPYRGKYRAIPVFAPDYSEIVDYFLMGIS